MTSVAAHYIKLRGGKYALPHILNPKIARNENCCLGFFDTTHWCDDCVIKKVLVGNDQEMVQSERRNCTLNQITVYT